MMVECGARCCDLRSTNRRAKGPELTGAKDGPRTNVGCEIAIPWVKSFVKTVACKYRVPPKEDVADVLSQMRPESSWQTTTLKMGRSSLRVGLRLDEFHASRWDAPEYPAAQSETLSDQFVSVPTELAFDLNS